MNTKMILVFLTAFFTATTCFSKPFDHTHEKFSKVLKEYVKMDGPVSTVNYAALKGKRQELDGYIKTLTSVSNEVYLKWNRERQLAFLINAYNALTIQIVLDNYPISSIKDIGSIFKSTWSIQFFTLLGKKRTLDGVEHGLIRGDKDYLPDDEAKKRKGFNEARIHFAVNCASIGCPALLNEAFVAKRLDQQLEMATNSFFGDRSRNRYDSKEHKLHLSPILKWYRKDFEKASGSEAKFVARRITPNKNEQQRILQSKPDVKYTNYDWKLNETKK